MLEEASPEGAEELAEGIDYISLDAATILGCE